MARREEVNRYYNQAHYGATTYDGNAVRKTELPIYSPNPNVRIKSSPQPKKRYDKVMEAKQRKAKARARRSAVLGAALIVMAAFLVLYRGVVITETTNRIEKKEKELTNLVATNQRLEMEIEHALDLKTVESAATERLGMSQPEKYQTVYVDLNQVDYVEKISGGNIGGATKLLAIFDKAKEYLD